MNKKKIKNYLESRGSIGTCWTLEQFMRILPEMDFKGEEAGYLRFGRTKKGRKWIQFLPKRCYIE